MEMMALVWLILLVVFAVVEALTMGLASLWFCVGAVAALITASCHGPLWLQLVLFLVVSGVAMLLIRPLAKKYFTPRHVRTNADRAIGAEGVVTEKIDNLAATGQVKVAGSIWTARTEDGSVLEEGSRVRVLRIEGVKLLVAPLTDGPSE